MLPNRAKRRRESLTREICHYLQTFETLLQNRVWSRRTRHEALVTRTYSYSVPSSDTYSWFCLRPYQSGLLSSQRLATISAWTHRCKYSPDRAPSVDDLDRGQLARDVTLGRRERRRQSKCTQQE